jgi:hypothetical protein
MVFMLEELGLLIDKIMLEHKRISEKWKAQTCFMNINMASHYVNQIISLNLIDNILLYTSFLNDNLCEFNLSFGKWDKNNSSVSTRVKARNSILYKIDNYNKNHENGLIPINKCLNDLFGIRIILKDEYTYSEIDEYIKEHYPKLKCIKADKMEYVATHIYFKYDNYTFQWELQVWSKSREQTNKNSHSKYKQDYVLWEERTKEEK